MGIIVGTGVGGLTTLQAECKAWLERGRSRGLAALRPDDDAQRRRGHDRHAPRRCTGPGFSLVAAPAPPAPTRSARACGCSQRGEADVVVAGGTEAALVGLCLAAFRRMGALSRDGVSRPFDARRDGFVMGEGAAVLVLERAEHARARGATALARIAGYGATNDAFHITQPDEDGRGVARRCAGARRRGREPADAG